MILHPKDIKKGSVLLIQRKSDDGETLLMWLQQEGYEVEWIETMNEVFDKPAQNPFTMALVDRELLGTNALTLLQALTHINPPFPITIILSANSPSKEKIELLRMGAFDFLLRPIFMNELTQVLNRARRTTQSSISKAQSSGQWLASEEPFRSVVEVTPDAIVLGNSKGNVISWNQAAQQMFGYTPEEILNKPLTCLMPQRYHYGHQEGLKRVQTTGQSCVVGKTVELVALRKDGSEFPIELSVSYSHLANEIFYCGLIRDITRRKQMEQALRESEDRFALTVNHIKDAVFFGDLAGVVLWANLQASVLLDRSLDQIIGRPLMECLSPEAAHLAESRLALVKEGVTIPSYVEFEFLRPDGSSRWVEANVTNVIRNEKIEGRLLIGRDITDRKRAQNAHQRATEQIERTLAVLPGSILVVGEDQRVVYANAEAYRNFEPKGSRLLGCPIHEAIPLPAHEWKNVLTHLSPEKTDTPYTQPELEFSFRDRIFTYRIFPIAFEEKKVTQTGVVLWDITQQKKLQAQLLQSEKLSNLGTLVSGMVHEVRNPLQAICGMAGLIRDEGNLDLIRELSEDIQRITKHITVILRDFLAYARPATNEIDTDLDLRERLIEAVRMVQRGPYFEKVEVEYRFTPIPPITARQGEIDQALINLISNAAQAMGGKGRLTLTTDFRDTRIIAQISDTGKGIPEENLDKIFEPFFSTKEKGEGTGLGLSIVQQIIKRYKGDIMVESLLGEGTTFTLQFPSSQTCQSV